MTGAATADMRPVLAEVMPRELASPVAGVRLWLADLDCSGGDHAEAWLSPTETARSARFRFERDRRRYRAGHAVLRRLLSASDTLLPRAEFQLGPHGKPSSGGCPFNVSDSGPVLLVAIGAAGGAELGVDLELLRPMEDSPDLARRHLSATECASLRAASSVDAPHLFLRAWTRKEACLKAVGLGLNVDTSTIEVGLEAQERKVTVRSESGSTAVRVRSIDVGAGRLAALAWVDVPQT